MLIERSLEEIFSVLRLNGESRSVEYDLQYLAVSLCCCSSKKITALKKKYIYQKINNSKMTCSGIIKSGPNKGQNCRLNATNGKYCKTHAKSNPESSDDSDSDSDIKKRSKTKNKLKTIKSKKRTSDTDTDSDTDSEYERRKKLKKKKRHKKVETSSDSDSSSSDSDRKRERRKKKKKKAELKKKKKKREISSSESSSESSTESEEEKIDKKLEQLKIESKEEVKEIDEKEEKVERRATQKIRPIGDDDLVIRPNRFRNFIYPGTNLIIDVKDKKIIASEGLDGRWIALEKCDIEKCKELKIKYKIIDLEFHGQK